MRRLLQKPLFWFLLALVPRLLYLFEQSATSPTFYRPQLDEAEMVETADLHILEWKTNMGFFRAEPIFKAPLYPFVLALVRVSTGDLSLWLMRLFQHLLGAMLCVIAFDTARRFFDSGDRRAAWAGPIAAALLALNGPLIRLENSLLLDFPVTFLQSAMVWALLRAVAPPAHRSFARRVGWILGAGLLAALAWLTRPTILPVLPVLSLALVIALESIERLQRRILLAAVLVFPLMVAVGGFMRRNQVNSDIAMWQPWQGGYNFFEANRGGANGRYLKQRAFVTGGGNNPTHDLMVAEFRAAFPNPPGEISTRIPGDRIHAWYMSKGYAEIRKDPWRWLGLMARKAMWLGSEREIYNIEDYGIMRDLSNVLPWTFVGFGFLLPFTLASLAVGGLRRGAVGVVWTYAIALGGCIALFFVSGRLRMPLVFPAAVLAAAGLAGLPSLSARRKQVAVSLAALGTAWAWGDWWGVRSEDFRAPEYARLSNATWQDGYAGKALALADLAEAADPDYPTLPQLRAQALFSQQKYAEAAAEFELAAQRIPNDPVAPFNLGLVYFRQLDDPARALPWFEESQRRDPRYLDAVWMRPRTLFRMGKTPEAIGLLKELLRAGNGTGSVYHAESLYWGSLVEGGETDREMHLKRLESTPWGQGRVKEIDEEFRKWAAPSAPPPQQHESP